MVPLVEYNTKYSRI